MSEESEHLDEMIDRAHGIVNLAIQEHITDYVDKRGKGRKLAATFILFSGGNDSTVLAHMFRDRATHAVHANTGIGIEATRQFVRDTCSAWGMPLLERHPPAGSTYRELVMERGFPGPAQHWKMYQRLKLRALEQAQREVIENPYQQRVIFLAGRRRAESQRRETRHIPSVERRRSNIWVSPLVNWTALDMNAYRRRFPDCPRNEVADILHMSGECLCGAFAKPDELDEIAEWYPEIRTHIESLERDVTEAGIVAPCNRWGWGADRRKPQHKTGPMCSSCEAR